jgi:hypothetical protein
MNAFFNTPYYAYEAKPYDLSFLLTTTGDANPGKIPGQQKRTNHIAK